jgi:hypothetical protein
MRVVVAALGLILLTGGCGGHGTTATGRGDGALRIDSTGRGVLADVYDGRLDKHWSCGSLRAAIARLPADPPTYSTLPLVLSRAARKACARHL